MFYKTAVCAAAISALSSTALAQQFGGELGLSYAYPTDSGDLAITEYFGALEYNFNQRFSVGADLTGYSIEDQDPTFASSTLHLTYHLNSFSSVGVFTGRDVISDADSDTTLTSNINGIEAGAGYQQFEFEGYAAKVTGGDEEPIMFGVDGTYQINDQISAFLDFDFANGDDLSARRYAIGGTYEIRNGPELYAQVGQRSAETGDVEGDSNFIELGAKIQFGTNRGTTFNGRSFFELIPNF